MMAAFLFLGDLVVVSPPGEYTLSTSRPEGSRSWIGRGSSEAKWTFDQRSSCAVRSCSFVRSVAGSSSGDDDEDEDKIFKPRSIALGGAIVSQTTTVS